MKSEAETVLAELHLLAQKHELTHLAMLIDDIRTNASAHRIVVAASSETDITSFRNWAGAVLPTTSIITLTLEELSVNPTPIITAERPVTIFECGHLIEADAIAVILTTFLTRPAGTYAIVMSHAERLETEEDLQLIERSISRLLLSTSMSAWQEQSLLEHGVYLWSNTHPIEWLSPRLQRDRDALIAWLRSADEHEDNTIETLMRYRLLYALDVAENELSRLGQIHISESSPMDQVQRIYNTRQSIGDLKLQLTRHIDDSVSSVERSLLTSLHKLQADLLGGLHVYLVENRDTLAQGEEAFQWLLTRYIVQGARGWQSQADQILISSHSYVIADAETLVEGIDWSLINQLALSHEQNAVYPSMLIEALTNKSVDAIPHLQVEQRQGAYAGAEGNVEQPSLSNIIRAVIGGGVTASVALLLGLGPIGAAASGIAGVVGMEMIRRRRRPGQPEDDYEQRGRDTIQYLVREASLRVQEQLQDNSRSLRQAIATESGKVEALLDQALHEQCSQRTQDNPIPQDLQKIQEYRRIIEAAAQ